MTGSSVPLSARDGDVYDWAGERRTVNTRKPEDRSAPFFPMQRFDLGVPATFDQLAERNFRPGMPLDEFVNKLTRTYDEVIAAIPEEERPRR